VPAAAGVRSWLPLVGNGPLQLPDAEQLVAFKADQEIVAELGRTIEFGESVKVGKGGATAVKLTEFSADVPAAFVQVSEYWLAPGPETVTVWLPLAAKFPLQLPEAMQLVALIVDQVSVVEPPTATVYAPNVSAGTANAVSAWMNP
jgi:hypothetical protein